MLNPLPPTAADVCSVCLTFTQGFGTCYPCGHNARFTDAVLPVSYSVHFGQLHNVLQQYKRGRNNIARPLQLQLAAVLWRFVAAHERCLADVAATDRFDLVTTVPSSDQQRDESHPLRRIVDEVVEPTRDRYQRLLRRSGTPVPERTVDSGKYNPTADLDGENVLLIDDHLDVRRERPERGGRVEDGRRRSHRRHRHRPPHEGGLQGQRPATEGRSPDLRLGHLCPSPLTSRRSSARSSPTL